MTPIQIKIMRAVSAGKVTRMYRGGGSVIDGAHSETVVTLEKMKLIAESGKANKGVFITVEIFELTDRGRKVMAEITKLGPEGSDR